MFLKRQLQTRLDLLKPSLERKITDQQDQQKSYHDAHSKDQEFVIGETVLAQNLHGELQLLKVTGAQSQIKRVCNQMLYWEFIDMADFCLCSAVGFRDGHR